MAVSVIIGANYGDEGKGLATDFFSAPQRTLNIRFNGGAQAGHTVVRPDGSRHVFHHMGSGTFQDATTFLSRFFVMNPIAFHEEYTKLAVKGFAPKILVDPQCPVTTSFDMLLNQAVEEMRGAAKHGSCGFGINETVVRTLTGEFAIYRHDLNDLAALEAKLVAIRDVYLPKRVKELGLKELPKLYDHEMLIPNFLNMANFLARYSKEVEWIDVVRGQYMWHNIVFEGAQGLRLDMDSEDFPHVTRSKTGLANVDQLLKEAKFRDKIDVYYMTRSYLTRHGAGPLANELPQGQLPYPKVKDDTNLFNLYQEKLRFAHLDFDRMFRDIRKDLDSVKGDYVPHLFMTCMDQTENYTVRAHYKNDLCSFDLKEGIVKVAEEHGMRNTYASFGPTIDDVSIRV